MRGSNGARYCFDVQGFWRYQSEILVGTISAELSAFLRDCVSSYEALESLLLLARHPSDSWSAREVAEAIGATEESVEAALEELEATGRILTRKELGGASRVQYTPGGDTTAALVRELEAAYAQQRLVIVQLMSANALERLRGAAARRLADAFRLRGPKR